MELHLLLPLVLIPAIVLGQLMHRAGLPAVIGQILAGVLLGPIGFGLVQAEDSYGEGGGGNSKGFYELAQIGLCVLLFKIGLETQISHFTQVWRRALRVALIGMALPLGLGIGVGFLLQWSLPASLFLGAALTATSIGVTAAVFDEMGIQNSQEARIIMGAAVVDDILGLMLLSVITAFAVVSDSAGSALGIRLIQSIGFLAAAFVLGPLVVRIFDKITDWLRSQVVLVALAFGFLLFMAHLADTAGLAAIIGSYAAGLAFSKRDEAVLGKSFEPLTELLSPIFFVLIGSSITFESGFGWADSGILLLLVVVAIGSKMAAPFLTPLGGASRGLVGSGLVPRGEVGLVFAQVGLTTLALDQRQYSVLALVILLTTLAGPLIFRGFARRADSIP